MAQLAIVPVATCFTCATAFYERDEDGMPEIPGQRCAHPGCEVWICEGGCLERFSFVCECGARCCSNHRVEQWGMVFCPACGTREWNLCQECRVETAKIARRLPDGMGMCADCYKARDRETRGLPDCPGCHHRLWVHDMDERVWINGKTGKLTVTGPRHFFRCDCGLKFSRDAANAERERTRPPQPERRVLFAPAAAGQKARW